MKFEVGQKWLTTNGLTMVIRTIYMDHRPYPIVAERSDGQPVCYPDNERSECQTVSYNENGYFLRSASPNDLDLKQHVGTYDYTWLETVLDAI